MRIPVILLTGFLGAGKTSLLSRLLRDPRFSDTAVIINEFGEVGLDHLLVEHLPDEPVVEMTSGCLCCTVRGDVRRALLMLHHRSEAGELPLFSRLIIETTGLADPAPVVHTLLADPRVAARFALAGVVTIVDAVNGQATLAAHREAARQVAIADRLLITKTDLDAGRDALPALCADLARRAPGATIADTRAPDFDLRQAVDGLTGFDAGTRPADVVAWLNAEAYAQNAHQAAAHEHDHSHGHGHDHAHHHDHAHDVNRHSDDIRAFCLTLDQPLDPAAFAFALELLAAHQGPDLLRVKGLVAITDYPDHPVVIHMVQHLIEPPVRLDAWPGADRRSRLVFITRNIDPARLAAFFADWTGAGADAELISRLT
ncbi:GTP-binding protein [Sphingomonas changnyeongensis]|uniref:GTP-binding protein n=1 Tax=Sphingomonas changnyeongensis TaxID=2698679 RepID=A0A7Z2S7N4_9SPHN|nr:GTP-binding protein [Sphingomonas changnyeongensis]QHL90511.1 GTP-binding protein [Sphingomonas changnyeongensis]